MNTLTQRLEAIDAAVALGDTTLPADIPRSDELSATYVECADKLLLLERLDTGLDGAAEHQQATRRIFRDGLPSFLCDAGFASAVGPTLRYLNAHPVNDTPALADQMLLLAKAAEVTPLTAQQLELGQLRTMLAFIQCARET